MTYTGVASLDYSRVLRFPTMMVATEAPAGCRNHPARPAIGVCVGCRTRVCGECATKIEGINYCVTCLGQLAARQAARDTAGRAGDAGWPLAIAHMALLMLVLWGLLELALPGWGSGWPT